MATTTLTPTLLDTSETISYEAWVRQIFAFDGQTPPDFLLNSRDYLASEYVDMYDDGITVNDAIVKLHYRAAYRRADRNA